MFKYANELNDDQQPKSIMWKNEKEKNQENGLTFNSSGDFYLNMQPLNLNLFWNI